MVMVAPVSSCIPCIILPPGPITAPMNSLGISNATMRGTCGLRSARGSARVSVILPRMCSLPALACMRAFSRMSYERPSHLMSICVAVRPFFVPVVLKSMSPRWSSSPRMSERIAYLSSPGFFMRPIAMPATGFLIGTPASIRASVPAQVVAIEDDPFDSSTSDTTRTVYG